MEVINSISSWRKLGTKLKNESIGFVPTMGNLHAGHESLIVRAKNENDSCVLSIFINPTQFNDKSDYENYPKTLEHDLKIAKELGVDYVFAPPVHEMYPDDFHFKITEDNISTILEGKCRPGHFNGMLTVVMKLFCIIKPQRAYFGEKDYQQLKLVQDLVKAFFLDIEIIPCSTVRANNGLALSSRNTLLTQEQLNLASLLNSVLISCKDEQKAKTHLEQSGFLVEYLQKWDGRLLAAVKIGKIRLIDNVAI